MKHKWIFPSILILLLAIALWRLDMAELWRSVRQIPLWLLAVLALMQVLTQLLINLQWYAISNHAGVRVKFWQMVYVNSCGAVVDAITHGVKVGGEVARVVRLKKVTACSAEQAVTVVAIQKMFSFTVFLGLCLLATGFIITEASHIWMVLVGIIALVALVVTVLLVLRQKLRRFFRILREQLRALKQNRKLFFGLCLLSLFIWILYPLKMYLLAVEVSNISVIYVTAATFTAYAMALFPIFPGGLGGFEGATTGLLLAFGLAIGDAVAITVVFRFITFWFVMLLALGVIIARNSIRACKKREKDVK